MWGVGDTVAVGDMACDALLCKGYLGVSQLQRWARGTNNTNNTENIIGSVKYFRDATSWLSDMHGCQICKIGKPLIT